MRKLKYHEYKLLKKVDFLQWKKESNLRSAKVVRKYFVQDPEDYFRYSKICGYITELANKLKDLDKDDPVRIERTKAVLEKLYNMGLIPTVQNLEQCSKITVSSFCRRRFPVILKRLKFAENLKEAVSLIEQGHLRIGTDIVKDPALLITRSMEDFITWSDASKIKRKVMKYNNKLDDYDLLD